MRQNGSIMFTGWSRLLLVLLLAVLATPSHADSTGVWEQAPPPSERVYHTAIRDPVRDRMIVFGGDDGFVARNDAWAFNLAGDPTWAAIRAIDPLPVARANHTAVYDPVRERLIVFGGFVDPVPSSNETWVLDLSGVPAWRQLETAGNPPPGRGAHAAIYDPVRDRMVVFGGIDADVHADLWELSLSGTPTWTRLEPQGTVPAARFGHSAILDQDSGRMIVFGGLNESAYTNDVWALELTGPPVWTRLTTVGSLPGPRAFHSASYDPVRHRMLVCGGGNDNDNSVWILALKDSLAWTEVRAAGTPPVAGFEGHSAVYDPVRDRLVVFGGQDQTRRNATWELRLSPTPTWRQLETGVVPSERGYPTAVLDAPRGRMIAFGGVQDDNQPQNDVWSFDLAGAPTWTRLTPSGAAPAPRLAHTAIADPLRERMLLFGGGNTIGNGFSDVWSLSLAGSPAWGLVSTSTTRPSARGLHCAVYDSIRDRMLVFGGVDPSGYKNDVWGLPLGGPGIWTLLAPAGTPPSPREGSAAIFDPLRDRLLIFGGFDGAVRNDVWALELSGTPTWTQLTPSGTPPRPREGHSAIHDSGWDRMVIHGGETGSTVYADVWALNLSDPVSWSIVRATGMKPPPHYAHAAIYDPAREEMITFAGIRRNDLFRLRWASLVDVDPPAEVSQLALGRLFPNPASQEVSFSIEVPHPMEVSIVVHDVRGRKVRRIHSGPLDPGRHVLRWDRRTDRDGVVPSGVYFIRMDGNGTQARRRVILVP